MTSTSRALPGTERCDRPSSAFDSTAGDQPGRLAQGPEEKHGLAGRRVGFIVPSLPRKLGPCVGRVRTADPMRRPGDGQCCVAAMRAEPRCRRSAGSYCYEECELEDRQAGAVRQPSLAYLFL